MEKVCSCKMYTSVLICIYLEKRGGRTIFKDFPEISDKRVVTIVGRRKFLIFFIAKGPFSLRLGDLNSDRDHKTLFIIPIKSEGRSSPPFSNLGKETVGS